LPGVADHERPLALVELDAATLHVPGDGLGMDRLAVDQSPVEIQEHGGRQHGPKSISQRVGPKGPSEARVSERAQAQPSTIRVRLAGVKKASASDRRARAKRGCRSARRRSRARSESDSLA